MTWKTHTLRPRRLPGLLAFACFCGFLAFSLNVPAWGQSDRPSVFSAPALFPLVSARSGTDARPVARMLAVEESFAVLRSSPHLLLESFPIPGDGTVDLEIRSFTLFDEHSLIVAMTEAGPVRRPAPDITLYRGSIRGEKGSWVYLAVERRGMSGTIITGGRTYTVFTPDAASLAPGMRPVVTVSEATEEERSYLCGVTEDDEFEGYRPGRPARTGWPIADVDTLLAQIAVEADEAAYKHYKTVEATENYITARMGESSAIYERDLSITFRIPFLRVWTTTDPFPGSSDRELLNVFTNYWREKMDTVSRTLAVLITRKPISADGVSQGLAWVDVLCSRERGCALVKFSANNSYITGHVGVLAHEIGHNFGSHHTHSCVWNPPIDSCYTAEPRPNQPPCFSSADIHLILGGGELMSYCHMRYGNANKHNIFRERVGTLVRSRAEDALCMEAVSAIRMLALTAPLGGESLCGGDSLLVAWDASGNNDLVILLSRNSGISYDTVLASGIPRTARSWIWRIPGNFPPGKTYRIRVKDSRNETLVDEMDADFEIKRGVYIAAQNTWRNVCVGEGASFWVKPGGEGPFTYQWKKNGQIVPGASDSLVWFQNMQVSDNLSTVTCIVRGACGSAESQPALLKVFSQPIIVKQPNSDTVCVGGRAVIRLEAEGPELHYRWFEMPGGIIHDVDSPEFVIDNVRQQKAYYCEVSSPCGKVNSASGFTIVPDPSVSFLSPKPYEELTAGGTFDIAWKAYCIDDVTISYSLDNGANWSSVTDRTPAGDGRYTWRVPTTETNSGVFRIGDADVSGRTKISPTFRIRKRPIPEFSGNEINFGVVEAGTTARQALTIENKGLADFTVQSVSFVGTQDVAMANALPFTVPASMSDALVFEWTPKDWGPLNGSVVLVHNGLRGKDTLALVGDAFVATSAAGAPTPASLRLSGQYPNPVTGAVALVEFDLPRALPVHLALYSLLGTEIRTLASGFFEAGRHRTTFEASALPAGVYVLRLAAGGESRSQVVHVMR
ncbi:MAG: zinc-dependent metalloprotease family protein [Bacteroidota bacterium]|nr:zinc-dependent metalloprotease family protein [Bacteroidota bacterium]